MTKGDGVNLFMERYLQAVGVGAVFPRVGLDGDAFDHVEGELLRA